MKAAAVVAACLVALGGCAIPERTYPYCSVLMKESSFASQPSDDTECRDDYGDLTTWGEWVYGGQRLSGSQP